MQYPKNGIHCRKNNMEDIISRDITLRTVDIDDAENTLLKFVKVDRSIRNYSNDTDYDKFCESTNIAIEKYIAYTHSLEDMIKNMQGGD